MVANTILLAVVIAIISVKGNMGQLSDEERQIFLDEHNRLRTELARGEIPGLPPAADMNRLEWDYELEAVAVDRLKRCEYKHDRRDGHSDNLAYNTMYDRVGSIKDAINGWWLEYKDFHYSNPFDGKSVFTSHFTQMAWGNTRRLGCSLAEKCSGDVPPNSTIVLCNYAPWGNLVNTNFYHVGKPCSQCESGTQCVDGLCSASQSQQPKNFKNNVPVDKKFEKSSRNLSKSKFEKEEKSKESPKRQNNIKGISTNEAKKNISLPKINQKNIAQSKKKHTSAEHLDDNKFLPVEEKLEELVIPNGYYCFTRVPSICELAKKYGVYKEPNLFPA